MRDSLIVESVRAGRTRGAKEEKYTVKSDGFDGVGFFIWFSRPSLTSVLLFTTRPSGAL